MSDVTRIFAVDVGVRCSVKGCERLFPPAVADAAAGLGRARTCERKFISRKWAWSSMISQSVAVKGSMWTACA